MTKDRILTAIEYALDRVLLGKQMDDEARLAYILNEVTRMKREEILSSVPTEDDANPPLCKVFRCPECGGEVGHRINCPDGIAFS